MIPSLRKTTNQTALVLASELPAYGLRSPPRSREDEQICNQTTLKIGTRCRKSSQGSSLPWLTPPSDSKIRSGACISESEM
eukprot:scaffold91761_cov97-Phaeocystis_antarctica.AAC.1